MNCVLLQVRVLKGHANWVKNIEYARNEEMLVTSGFDGSIYAWDINRYYWYSIYSTALSSISPYVRVLLSLLNLLKMN